MPRAMSQALMVLDNEWIDQLYVDQALTGRVSEVRSLHTPCASVRRVSSSGPFRATAAPHFYEAHQFVAIASTMGKQRRRGSRHLLRMATWPRATSEVLLTEQAELEQLGPGNDRVSGDSGRILPTRVTPADKVLCRMPDPQNDGNLATGSVRLVPAPTPRVDPLLASAAVTRRSLCAAMSCRQLISVGAVTAADCLISASFWSVFPDCRDRDDLDGGCCGTRSRSWRSGLTYRDLTRVTTKTHCDGLSDPPRGIGGEREPLLEIELLDRDSEALLSQSNPLFGGEIASGVPIGKYGHDPTMGVQEVRVGLWIATLSQDCEFGRLRTSNSGNCPRPAGVLVIALCHPPRLRADPQDWTIWPGRRRESQLVATESHRAAPLGACATMGQRPAASVFARTNANDRRVAWLNQFR